MSEFPDANGEFEVEGLPEAPGDGQWSIYKYPGAFDEWPNEWEWQGGLRYIMKLVCDGDDEYTWPITGFTNEEIAGTAESLAYRRLQHLRGDVAETMSLYPVPPAL